MENWVHIAEGVRSLVKELNDQGYTTTDSGDGSGQDDCSLPYWHIFGLVPEERDLRMFAEELSQLYPHLHVEVSYCPGGPALFALLEK